MRNVRFSQRCLTDGEMGFSLLELLIVVSLLGVGLSLTLPSYSHFSSDQRARAAAQALASDLGVAQQEAVTRRAEITVTFSSADAACSVGPVASYTLRQEATVIKRTCLPSDVVWTSRQSSPVIFQATGLPQSAMIMAIQSVRTGRRFSVALVSGTGVVTDDTH